MDIEVTFNSAKVVDVNGDVVAVDTQGTARQLRIGDTVNQSEIIITTNGATIELAASENDFRVDQNCVACFEQPDVESQELVQAPVGGDVSLDLSGLGEDAFGADDIAAIQQAILAGEDPTQILEATAAGAGAAGSANAGFVEIEYNNPQTIASTFFETSAIRRPVIEDPEEDGRFTVFAAGGESISELLVEGDLDPSTYPTSISSSVFVEAGDLALDPLSFVPEPLSLAALLSELNSDITSTNQDVVFTYDSAENAIVGVAASGEVVRIDIDVASLGKDLTLTLTTTVSEPLDHVPSVGGGNVALVGDQIVVNFQITGTDVGGNPIQLPIDATVTIGDGADPIITDVPNVSLDEENLSAGTSANPSALVTGSVTDTDIGSDNIQQYRLNIADFNSDDSLTSQGEPLTIVETANSDGSFTYVASTSAGEVFVVNLDTAGSYSFELKATIDHPQGSDSVTVELPIVATDFDGDTAQNNLPITIIDDIPVLSGFTGQTNIDEDDIVGLGSSVGGDNPISGNFAIAEGADGIKSYQLTNGPTALSGIESEGEAVVWANSGNPTTVTTAAGTTYTYTAETSKGTVFTLVFNTAD
ncbi:retention module-containing protein, partial [Vibrio sp. LaRot3]|uniref:retention module-containing protein n=1 Tax=Vibrio sp. LaRot3 TaxID=2998829 RepID=UPI0022CDFCE7